MKAKVLAAAAAGLVKVFGEESSRVEAVRGVDLEIDEGEFVAIMGPSGSGKSTLLHLMAGLDRPTSGTVSVAGQDLAALDDEALTRLRRRHIGLVFQSFNLVAVLSALENVALPLLIDGVPETTARARAAHALGQVGLGARGDHRPGQLSGGEQQRVAIARALVAAPELVLADEPTGNLDSETGDQVMRLLRSLGGERRPAVVLVTHDPRDAAFADRIIRLKDGRVVSEQRLPAGRSIDDLLAGLEPGP